MSRTEWIAYAATPIAGWLLAMLILTAYRRARQWLHVRRFIRARRNRPLAERVKDAEEMMDSIYPGFTEAYRKQEQKARAR